MRQLNHKVRKMPSGGYEILRTETINITEADLRNRLLQLNSDLIRCNSQRLTLDEWETNLRNEIAEIEKVLQS